MNLFILFLLIIIFYLIFKLLKRLFIGWLFSTHTNNHRQEEPKPKTPENQEDRILEYQKKSFEKTDVEDVEFEEIKTSNTNQ